MSNLSRRKLVTGGIVAVIGLNLAAIPVKNMAPTGFDAWMQVVTFMSIGVVAVFAGGIVRRLLILVGLILASIIYAVLTNGMGIGTPIDTALVANAAWFGAPQFTSPVFTSTQRSSRYRCPWEMTSPQVPAKPFFQSNSAPVGDSL